jgi:hypothetical protein
VEWAKARACTIRFGEEVDLLQEEMRRTLQWLLVRSQWWITRSSRDTWSSKITSVPSQNGHVAYAYRQAAIYRGLGVKFAKMWASVLTVQDDVTVPALAVVDDAEQV